MKTSEMFSEYTSMMAPILMISSAIFLVISAFLVPICIFVYVLTILF